MLKVVKNVKKISDGLELVSQKFEVENCRLTRVVGGWIEVKVVFYNRCLNYWFWKPVGPIGNKCISIDAIKTSLCAKMCEIKFWTSS
jgi:hypothetical protein